MGPFTRIEDQLEPYRRYLLVLASVHLAPELRQKLDPADLVQQTLMRAYVAFAELRSTEPAVLLTWLRKVLANELTDAIKHYHRDKRDVKRELAIEAEIDQSASGMANWLAGDEPSPSARAMNNEQLLRLADALAQLPDTMREVVVLKHCQNWTLQQISQRLGKTVPAIASYLRRGLEQLRQTMNAEESHDPAQ